MESIYQIAFLAGLLSFVSPCIIPMITVYFSLITGLSIDELEKVDDRGMLARSVFIKTVLFVLAFTVVFTLAGGAAGEVGRLFKQKLWIINAIGGIFIILLGLKTMGVLKLAWLDKINPHRHYEMKNPVRNKYLTAFLVGLFFAVACSHCIAPTLYSILILAGGAGSPAMGMTAMFFFSVGLAIPYLIVAVFISRGLGLMSRLARYKRGIAIATGLFMVVLGGFMLTGNFSMVTGFFNRLLPYKLPIGM